MVSNAAATPRLLRIAAAVSLPVALSNALGAVAQAVGVHDSAKTVLDPAVSAAICGDSLADSIQQRPCPEVFGLVASDLTVARCLDALRCDAPAHIAAFVTTTRRGQLVDLELRH